MLQFLAIVEQMFEGRRFKKILVNAVTWKIIIGYLHFYVKLPMSMEITWLDFQLSTDNQNGHHLATKFFFST